MARSYLFDAYLNLIGNGKSAAEATATLVDLFGVDENRLVAILDNMGDEAKAERDYANHIIRDQLERRRGGNRLTVEVSDDMIRNGGGIDTSGMNQLVRGT